MDFCVSVRSGVAVFCVFIVGTSVTAQITYDDRLKPTEESDAHKIDQLMFQASDSHIASLFAHPNRSVKMRAFWERERRRPSTGDGRMQGLIGHYEACLGRELPKWWSKGLQEGAFEGAKRYDFGESALKSLKLRSIQIEDNFEPEIIGDVEMKLFGEKLRMSLNGKCIFVQKDFVLERYRDDNLSTVTFDSTRDGNYLVQICPFGTKFVLSRLADDGTPSWTSIGWATGDYPGSGNGSSVCFASLEATTNSVFVFGYCGGSHFVEELSNENGHALMRFCSTYTRSKLAVR